MNTLQQTTQILFNYDLIATHEEFSTKWANKNKGWLAYTTHKQRDYSTDAAFNVLRETRKRINHLKHVRQRLGGVVEDTLRALARVEALLLDYLKLKHSIVECVLDESERSDKYW
jgi:hypothetical protein